MASIDKKQVWNKTTGKLTTRYYIRYYDGTGANRKRKTLPGGFTRKHDAEVALGRMLAEQAAGTFGKEEPKAISFSDFANQWLLDYAALKKGSTRDDYAGVVNKHLKPFFGDQDLRQITKEEVQGFVTAERDAGYSPRTINKVITIMKLIFKKAIESGRLDSNPAVSVDRPSQQRREREFLNPDEIRRLLKEAPEEYLPLYAIGVLAGLREGEILALRWMDVDLEEGLIYVRRSYHDKHGFGDPKSDTSRRAVDMSPRLLAILTEYKNRAGGALEDLLFPGKDSEKPISRQNLLQRHFYRTLEAAGLKKVTFHALRHSYAALMIASKASIKYLQHQMGHSTIRVTLDLYGHILPEVGEGVTQRMDELIWGQRLGAKSTKKRESKPSVDEE